MLEPEPSRKVLAESADPERLGRVVAGSDDVDAELPGAAVVRSETSPVSRACAQASPASST